MTIEKRIFNFCIWFLSGAILLVLLTSCAPDPRKEAQAFEIREKAEQDAINQAQNRKQAAELHEIQVQQLEVEQGHREATKQEWRDGLNRMIKIGFWFATAAVCFTIFYGARTTVSTMQGVGAAIVKAADTRASLIYLDPKTRQFPLLPSSNGRFLANPNVHGVLPLNESTAPDPQMVFQSGAVQYAGALAQEAKQADDPAGVSIIQAPVIDVKSEIIELGKSFLRRNDE